MKVKQSKRIAPPISPPPNEPTSPGHQVLLDKATFDKLTLLAKSARNNAETACIVQHGIESAIQALLRIHQQCMAFTDPGGAPIFMQAFDPEKMKHITCSNYGLGADEAPGARRPL